jgi:uncharacterized membrane protein
MMEWAEVFVKRLPIHVGLIGAVLPLTIFAIGHAQLVTAP